MLRIALMNVADGYTKNLVFQIIAKMADVEVTSPRHAQLIIKGPYKEKSTIKRFKNKIASKNAVVLFDSAENTRYLHSKADYYITHDLGVSDPRHMRIPHWYNVIDWRHEGLPELGESKRFGKSILIEELMAPRSMNNFLEREHAAAIIAGHLNEPRKSIIQAVEKQMKVVGYGKAYDKTIKNHNKSGMQKRNILKNFKFNICPENSLGIGYYTEKLVEAYAAGCIPLYWSDQNISYDFNENSFINIAKYVSKTSYNLPDLNDEEIQKKIISQPLLKYEPKIDSIFSYLSKIVEKSKRK